MDCDDRPVPRPAGARQPARHARPIRVARPATTDHLAPEAGMLVLVTAVLWFVLAAVACAG